MQHYPSILIIDDDHDLRFLLGQLLDHAGFTIFEAANGQEALAVLEVKSPSILLIDLDMPVMNGKDLVLHLENDPSANQKWGKIPRVIYSARVDLYSEIFPLVDASIEKPVNHEKLIETIRITLKKRG